MHRSLSNRTNIHVWDSAAARFAKTAGMMILVLALVALMIAAFLGIQAIIIDTGRAILHP